MFKYLLEFIRMSAQVRAQISTLVRARVTVQVFTRMSAQVRAQISALVSARISARMSAQVSVQVFTRIDSNECSSRFST